MERVMATTSARRNINISIASDNADFIKQNGMNLSKAVDALIKEMRRKKTREEWTIENKAALTERCRLLESEGGTAAERFYGVHPTQET
jgi:post-segregation antitoxin (ccd killing protein)